MTLTIIIISIIISCLIGCQSIPFFVAEDLEKTAEDVVEYEVEKESQKPWATN